MPFKIDPTRYGFSDIDDLARSLGTLQGEAGNQSVFGRALVLDTAANRGSDPYFNRYNNYTQKGTGDTYTGIAAQLATPSQFSTWNPREAGAYKSAKEMQDTINKIGADPTYYDRLSPEMQRQVDLNFAAADGVLGSADLRGIAGGATFYSTGNRGSFSDKTWGEHQALGLGNAMSQGAKIDGEYWYGHNPGEAQGIRDKISGFDRQGAYDKLISQYDPDKQRILRNAPEPPARPNDGSDGISPRPPGWVQGVNDASDGFTRGLEDAGRAIAGQFQAALGRLPSGEEVKSRVDAIASGATSLFDNLRDIAVSPEAKAWSQKTGIDARQYIPNVEDVPTYFNGEWQTGRSAVDDAYSKVLGRPADATGSDFFSQQLQNGALNQHGLEEALAKSPEYAQTHPAQDTETVGPGPDAALAGPGRLAEPTGAGRATPTEGPPDVQGAIAGHLAGTEGPGPVVPTEGPGPVVPTRGPGAAVSGFDPTEYLKANTDVAAAGVDPIAHFLRFGQYEDRALNLSGQHFDSKAYLAANPDVAMAGLSPIQHYLEFGGKEGRKADLIGPDGTTQTIDNWLPTGTQMPTNFADILNTAQAAHTQGPGAVTPTQGPGAVTPTIGASGLTATQGPGSTAPTLFNGFDAQSYKAANADVAASGMDPIAHFLRFGQYEDRPMTLDGVKFDGKSYLAANPDVAMAGLSPLEHYLASGKNEGRATPFEGLSNDFDFSKLNVGNFGLPGLGSSRAPAAAPKPADTQPLGSGIAYNNGSTQYGGVDIGPAGLFDPASSEKAYLNTQVDQINAGAAHSAQVENQLTQGKGVPMPTFAVNGTNQGNSNVVAQNQGQYLNNVNTALAGMAPVAPSGASFLVGMPH